MWLGNCEGKVDPFSSDRALSSFYSGIKNRELKYDIMLYSAYSHVSIGVFFQKKMSPNCYVDI